MEIEKNLLENVFLEKKRSFYPLLDLEEQTTLIWWERWVWKTYMLLQKRKELGKWFYFSADNIIVRGIWLFELIFNMYKNFDIRNFFIDEIHKYPNWIQEVKNIIDSFPQCKFVFSGSNSISIYKWTADLWRRIYDIHILPLSFREFLYFYYNEVLPVLSIEDILENYILLSNKYISSINFIKWKEYCRYGIYPYYKKWKKEQYINKLSKNLEKVITEDLQGVSNFTQVTLQKLKDIFLYIWENKPSDISIAWMSKKLWISDDILSNVLYILDKVWIVKLIYKFWTLSVKLRKPKKVFLWNTNLYTLFDADRWTLREVMFLYFISSISKNIWWIKEGDYWVKIWHKNYIFEIGWTSKKLKTWQIWVIDDIYPDKWKIPLRLFWFLW